MDKIHTIANEEGISSGSIIIQDGADEKKIFGIKKNAVILFADAVRKVIRQRNENHSADKAQTSSSIADELLKYKQLLEMGAITEDEFSKLKSDLLK